MRKAPADWWMQLLPKAVYLRVLRGDAGSAVALVRTAVQLQPANKKFFRSAPWFKPLSADPRFIAAVDESITPR
jgi:hypothetical protein